MPVSFCNTDTQLLSADPFCSWTDSWIDSWTRCEPSRAKPNQDQGHRERERLGQTVRLLKDRQLD
ncbi:hypothetical protein NQZ68_012828 [Dissostichus eleginoides]|nr:hypothetical protein NQZ68_012828 [Dissostichus eleginoides]